MKSNKKLIAMGTLLVLLLLIAGNAYGTESSPDSHEEMSALIFLEHVVGLDVGAYNVSISDYTSHLKVVLSNEQSKFSAGIDFVHGRPTWISFGVQGAPILKVQYPDNLVDLTKDFLGRYRVHFNATYIDELIPMLEGISLKGSKTVTAEGSVLEVTVDEWGVSFRWNYRNGIEAQRKVVYISLENGFLKTFGDTWGVTKINNTDVNISKEEAKRIALEAAKDYIDRIGAEVVSIETTLDFYNDPPCPWGNYTGRGDDPYMLYPRWSVMLYFDKAYGEYSKVDGYYVGIWADTGEVHSSHSQGYYGSTTPLNPFHVLIAVITIPAILAVIVVYKKRRLNSVKTILKKI